MHAISLLAVVLVAFSVSAAALLVRRSEGHDGAGYVVDNNGAAPPEASAIPEWALTPTTADAATDETEQETTTAVGSGLPTGDCAILTFALTLEHLESAFYEESLNWLRKADFERAQIPNAAQVYRYFAHIAEHERAHVKTLQEVISSFCGTPVPPCKYNFGVTDVHSFLAVARTLEKIGVSAYDGAIALISNGDIQTAAATIATVEGRHASLINFVSGGNPFPQDFEVPVAGPAIVTMAASVIESCPFDIPSTLGATPFKSLKLIGPSTIRSGRNIQLEYEGSVSGGHFCSFLFSDKSITVALNPGCGCRVPRGAHGDIYVAVVSRDEQLTLKNTDGLIVAGPTVIYVKPTPDGDCKDRLHQPASRHLSEVNDTTPEESHYFAQPFKTSAVTYLGNSGVVTTPESRGPSQNATYAGIPVHQAMPESLAPKAKSMASGNTVGSEQIPVTASRYDPLRSMTAQPPSQETSPSEPAGETTGTGASDETQPIAGVSVGSTVTSSSGETQPTAGIPVESPGAATGSVEPPPADIVPNATTSVSATTTGDQVTAGGLPVTAVADPAIGDASTGNDNSATNKSSADPDTHALPGEPDVSAAAPDVTEAISEHGHGEQLQARSVPQEVEEGFGDDAGIPASIIVGNGDDDEA